MKKGERVMRILVRLVGVLVLLLVLMVGVFLILPGEKIANLAADQFKAQTGRDLSFGGKVDLSFYPVLGFKSEGIELANADWSKRGPLLTAKGASVGIDAKALLSGNVRIRRIEVKGPKLILERRKDGTANWDFGAATADSAAQETAKPGELPVPTLKRLIIRNARINYFEGGKSVVKLKGLTADLKWPSRQKPIEVTGKFSLAGEPINFQTDITDPRGLINGNVSALKLTLNTKGGEVAFDGRVDTDKGAVGGLSVDLSDTSGFAAAFGVGGVEIPKGFGQSIKAKSNLTLTTEQKLFLRESSFQLDHNSLSGDVDIEFRKKRPYVVAKLASDALDLSSVSGGGGSGSSGWSKAPIDTSALGMIDGKFRLQVKALDTGDYKFSGLDTKVDIENARAVIDLAGLNAFGGSVAGQIVANGRKGFSSRVNVKANGIDMNRLLNQTAGIDRFTGRASMTMNVLASGASVHALMNSLKGPLSVSLGAGTITGIDLDALMSGRKGGGTTVFDSLTATGNFANGVLSNDDLKMKLISFTATGKGQIGVGPRNIDYTVTPVSITAREGETISVPVRIRGSWDNPKISVDLEKALEANFEEEIDAAKDKFRDKVSKELGVEREDGQSVEDVLEDKLKDGAESGLKKLLGVD